MDHSSPFAARRKPRDPRRARLLAELMEVVKQNPGKVPILLLGPRRSQVVVMHGADAVFIRRPRAKIHRDKV